MKTEESRTGKKHEFSLANERHCGTETYHEPLRKPSLNDKYRKLQRAGLKKLIEMEKERADQQSMLRWTMASSSDNRQTPAAAAEGMRAGREKSTFNRKLQKDQNAEHEERERKMMKIGSSLATILIANNRGLREEPR